MNAQTNAINWFEVPVTNMERARKFYEAVFNISMPEDDMAGIRMAYFPGTPESTIVSGALVLSPDHKPSTEGAVLYFNGEPAINPILDRITENGGQVLMPRTLITPEIGYMAFFLDTEGNKVALHATEAAQVAPMGAEATASN